MRGTPLVAAVVCLMGAVLLPPRRGAAQVWSKHLDGNAGSVGARIVAVDGSGDVVSGGSLRRGSVADFAVVKLAGGTGTELWRYTLQTVGGGGVRGIGVDAAQDVIAAGGTRQDTGINSDFTVVKLLGNTGAEVWHRTINGAANVFDTAVAVAVDATGDVIAVGSIEESAMIDQITIIKFAGSDGTQLWRRDLVGTSALHTGYPRAVALDGSGDVLVVGTLDNSGSGGDMAIVKLAGVDGTELWRDNINGTANSLDFGNTVAVDAGGDVVAAGALYNSGTGVDFSVVKVAGADGSEVWRRNIDGTNLIGNGDFAEAVAIDASGNVVAAGGLTPSGDNAPDFFVTKLAGASGNEMWRQSIGGDEHDFDVAFSLGLDPSGDVIAGGSIRNLASYIDGFVAKLSGATGAPQWRRVINGTKRGINYDGDFDVAVDASGNVFASGNTDNAEPHTAFTVLKLNPAGGDFVVQGKRLRVRNDGNAIGRRLFSLDANDPNIGGPLPGGLADPTVGGATLTIINPTTSETATFALPAGHWRAVGRPAGKSGYRYFDRSRSSGPCKSVRLRGGKRLRALCYGSQMTFALNAPFQGSLGVRLQTGTGGVRQCLLFGGTVQRDSPGLFKAKDAPAPAVCP